MPAHASGHKIATCCYCGTRAALVLRGEQRHELSCSRCGAPLHKLKMLPLSSSGGAGGATARAATPTHPTARQAHKPAPKPVHSKQPHPKARKMNQNRRAKGLFRKVLKEVWDGLEDILD